MKKKNPYVAPSQTLLCWEAMTPLMEQSLDPTNPSSGLDDQPGYGGSDDEGGHDVGAKPISVWD